MWRLLVSAVLLALLAGCGGGYSPRPSGKYYADDRPPDDYQDNHIIADAVPRVEPKSRGGNPKSYVVFNKRYYVMNSSKGYKERGIASWYGKKFHGRKTSNGETYDMYQMTAAHKSLPLPTYVEVENLKTGKIIVVRVNDRGPFHQGRIIDLSYAAAQKLGIASSGTGLVEVRAIDPRTWTGIGQSSTPPATAKTAASGSNIYLQVGAFSSRTNADRRLRQIAAQAISGAFIQQYNGVHRVRFGPLQDIEQADILIEKLIAGGFDEFHVVIE